VEVALSRRLTAEAIGTFGFFFLGFSGIAAAVSRPNAILSSGVALGFGGGLALMIFAFGHISGGHFNPAVSAGLAAGGRFPAGEVLPYWAAQIVGGLVAALLAKAVYPGPVGPAIVSHPTISQFDAFLVELVGTLLFVMVISAVATDKEAPWNGILAPVAIGGYIYVAATVIGPFSSGSFNPARSLAPAIVQGNFHDLWIFIFGPLIGGILGGLAYTGLRSLNEP
jgi:MIP family channel proteins